MDKGKYRIRIDIYHPAGPNSCVYAASIFVLEEADSPEQALQQAEDRVYGADPDVIAAFHHDPLLREESRLTSQTSQ